MQIGPKPESLACVINLPGSPKNSRSITEYLQAIRSLSDELATASAHVSNSELIVKILSGLGPEFREIFVAIRSRDTTVTYEELYEKLLDHELFVRHEESKKNSSLITAAPPNNANTNVIRCQLCNKIGHIMSVCRSKSHNYFEAKDNYISGFTTTANPWIIDSCATHNITTAPHNFQEYHGNEDVSMGDGNKIHITHTGSTQLKA
uniref:Uncharacterized protein LOC104219103 n=1 Tax=Nicotiana sylvestris TaxID=4096 RepID=A0A1U7VIZ0_NICSY|nr:PREDICTED: uncharacterized protein LOC104219103 [Nicotiana sylvestris]